VSGAQSRSGSVLQSATSRVHVRKQQPSAVGLAPNEAFFCRTETGVAALAADIPEPAINAAQSAQASHSHEKMLCHQMTAAHFSAMRLLEHSARPDLPPVEVARLTNAAARQMGLYQAAA